MDINLLVNVAMPIVTLFLGVFINRLFENRAKLISHLGYIAVHKLSPQEEGKEQTVVHTHSVIIRNNGRKAAKNVRLGHNFLPDFNVYPDIEYSINTLPSGSKEIIFPILTPKKEITISYLYFPPITWSEINTHIESDEGSAKIVQVLLQPQLSPIAIKTIWFLFIVGIISTVYTIIKFIIWAI